MQVRVMAACMESQSCSRSAQSSSREVAAVINQLHEVSDVYAVNIALIISIYL